MRLFKKTLKYSVWIIIIIIIGIFFSSLIIKGFSYSYHYINSKSKLALQAWAVQNNTTVEPTIIYKKELDSPSYYLRNQELQLSVSAEAYLVADLKTQEIILEKNKDQIFPLASVSKLMTALLSDPEDQLLYPLLLESSNSVAEKLAKKMERDEFIRKMNQEAILLGLFNTYFEDPSGLSSQNSSNVFDLFKLIKHIYNDKNYILEITKQEKYKGWVNNNSLSREKEYQGGKGGYTDAAKKTLIATFSLPFINQENNREIVIILLKSDDRYKDAKKIINYLKQNIYYGLEKELATLPLAEIIPEPKDNEISLIFTGDIMLNRGVRKSVEQNFNNDYGFLFVNILESLEEADILFGNLEGPASDQGKDVRNLYSFRMNPVVLPVLSRLGFDIVSVANNHANDWGQEAFKDTLIRIQENGLMFVGGGLNKAETEKVKIIERDGIKIGFLGFCDVCSINVESQEDQPGLLFANNPRFKEIINEAKNEVDFLITTFHWGNEYVKANDRQKKFARLAIDSGANLVIGHHPHVAQETEKYKGGFIAYSLGNFIFDQSWSEETMKGLILEVKINKMAEIIEINKKPTQLNKFFQPSLILKN